VEFRNHFKKRRLAEKPSEKIKKQKLHKMKKTILLVFTVIAVMLTTNGCKKGDTGPQGPAGTNGTNGSANVHSQTFFFPNWIDGGSQIEYYCILADADITQSIIDYGIVQVYIANAGMWTALPYSWNNYTTIFSNYLGNVKVEISHSDFSPMTSQPGTSLFKVVCVSGTSRRLNPNLNWNNYDEVKKAFNLAD